MWTKTTYLKQRNLKLHDKSLYNFDSLPFSKSRPYVKSPIINGDAFFTTNTPHSEQRCQTNCIHLVVDMYFILPVKQKYKLLFALQLNNFRKLKLSSFYQKTSNTI
jgi:hypothetical protein